MAEASLPRGRHGLTREEVERHQRVRVLAAVAATMAERGYTATTVADVIAAAGVSRETFYQLFDNKLDAFMAAFDLVADVVTDALEPSGAPGTVEAPEETLQRLIGAYLDLIAAAPEWARLFLVEVAAAGPDALVRRMEIQERIVGAIASAVGATSDESRFAIRVVTAAIGPMVTDALVRGDLDAVSALAIPLRRLAVGLVVAQSPNDATVPPSTSRSVPVT